MESIIRNFRFFPLSTVDYSGGINYYRLVFRKSNTNDSIKITVRFLSNEIRSDSLKIIVHKKIVSIRKNCKTKSFK